MCTFRGFLHININIPITSHSGHQYMPRRSLHLFSLKVILSDVSQLVTALCTRYCKISLSQRNKFHYLSSGRSEVVPRTTRKADHVRYISASHIFKECLACYRIIFNFNSSMYLISSSFTVTYFIDKCSYSVGSTCCLDLLVLHPIVTLLWGF
jgi:hypothetical protein